MGFWSGALAGAKVADSFIEGMKTNAEEKLFKAAQQLGAESQAIDAEGNAIQGMGQAFLQASPDDMAGLMLRQYAANGNKINDAAYKLAYGVAESLAGVRSKVLNYQKKSLLFSAKKRALAAAASGIFGGGSGGSSGSSGSGQWLAGSLPLRTLFLSLWL